MLASTVPLAKQSLVTMHISAIQAFTALPAPLLKLSALLDLINTNTIRRVVLPAQLAITVLNRQQIQSFVQSVHTAWRAQLRSRSVLLANISLTRVHQLTVLLAPPVATAERLDYLHPLVCALLDMCVLNLHIFLSQTLHLKEAINANRATTVPKDQDFSFNALLVKPVPILE